MSSCAIRSLALIGRGALAPGAQLPTMREVAVALAIDLNTVQRAYAELEPRGFSPRCRAAAAFVAEAPPPRAAPPRSQDLAAKVAAQAQAQGIEP